MAQQLIDHGTVAGDGLGESLFATFTKVNANETELYNGLGGLLSKSFTAASTTSATEVELASIAVPANTIGAHGIIRVTTFWEMTSSSNTKSMRVRLGAAALAGSLVYSGAATTIANSRAETTIDAMNSTSSQKSFTSAPRGTDYLVTQGTAALATSIDMTAAQNIVITGFVAGGETITLLGYIIQFVK